MSVLEKANKLAMKLDDIGLCKRKGISHDELTDAELEIAKSNKHLFSHNELIAANL